MAAAGTAAAGTAVVAGTAVADTGMAAGACIVTDANQELAQAGPAFFTSLRALRSQ